MSDKDFKIEIPMEELQRANAGNIDSIEWSGTYGGTANVDYRMKVGIAWSSVGYKGYSDVTARFWIHSAAIRTSNVKKNFDLSINGNKKTASQAFNMGDWNSTFKHKLLEHTVRVDHSSAKTVSITGNFAINITYSGVYVGTMTKSVNANIPPSLPTLTPPDTPRNCRVSGKYERGEHITVAWDAAARASGYYYERIIYNSWNKSWESWGNRQYTTSTSVSIPVSLGDYDQSIKFRVYANNAAGDSSWSNESGYLNHYGVKVNNSGFKWGTVRVWNGSNWVEGITRVWNGSRWTSSK